MSSSDQELLDLKLQRLKLLEERKKLREGLPHLHGFKFYKWARLYFESTNRFNFLSSANQVGKSSVSIRKAIHWATEPKLWKKLWPGRQPTYFFYLYPSLKLASREFYHKWVPEFLPRGEFKEHPQYGWRDEKKGSEISAVHFNSGISILFLSYQMDAIDLQASSPAAIFADEEIPVSIYPELVMRLEATKGYFHLVCTPTIGQQFFQEIFEKKRMADAFAMTVSMYQCLQYEDGSPGMYSIADIKRREAMLGTQADIDMRVHGKFVKTEGLVYPGFDREENVQPAMEIPSDWLWYSGVDIGSGGDNHLASICFTAVSPDFKKARVVESWVGNEFETTTAEDVLVRYQQMRGDRMMAGEYYDWASKDFHTIAMRAGVPMQPAEKNHTLGVNLMNTLFKNGMLVIEDTEMNQSLVSELLNLRHSTKKRHAEDDAIDSCRYSITKVPFDWSGIKLELKPKPAAKKYQDPRLEAMALDQLMDKDEIDAEIDELNNIYEG